MDQEYTGKNCTRYFGKPYPLTNPIYPKKIQVTLSEQKRAPPKHFSKLEKNNTNINLNIASYFINILASPSELTWFTTGGTITK